MIIKDIKIIDKELNKKVGTLKFKGLEFELKTKDNILKSVFGEILSEGIVKKKSSDAGYLKDTSVKVVNFNLDNLNDLEMALDNFGFELTWETEKEG